MHTPTPFKLENPVVSGELCGNLKSKRVVIFSHGFGVRRDSRGMFTDLVERLGDEYLCVLFDYVDIDEAGDMTVHPWSYQVKMLDEVIRWTQKQWGPEELTIVAHSQGCVITGFINPHGISKVILAASPTVPTSLDRLRKVFGHRAGTVLTEDGTSVIKRSDGTKTLIPQSFWLDTMHTDIPQLYANLAKKTKVYFISAKQDDILRSFANPIDKTNPDITFIDLEGNHEFAGEAREGWLDLISEIVRK